MTGSQRVLLIWIISFFLSKNGKGFQMVVVNKKREDQDFHLDHKSLHLLIQVEIEEGLMYLGAFLKYII